LTDSIGSDSLSKNSKTALLNGVNQGPTVDVQCVPRATSIRKNLKNILRMVWPKNQYL